MSDIPNEIYHEVLCRVPFEDLFLFRSVCRTWRRIIDHPTFAKQHIHGGVGQDWFFRRQSKGKLFLLPMKDLIHSKESFHLAHVTNVKTLVGTGVPRLSTFPVPSCNGLILISSFKKNLAWRIWNPFTGETLELKKCTEFANGWCQIHDYVRSGIGYDESNDDCKVVTIVKLNTYVYSVNSKEWRRIEDFPGTHIRGRRNGVFAYGALHWSAYSDKDDARWIAALDLSTENYRKIELPLGITHPRQHFTLNDLSGCFFLSSISAGCYVMWMLKDYACGDTWIKMISFKASYYITAIAYEKSKKQVLLHRQDTNEHFWYDEGKKCVERVGIKVNADGFEDGSDCCEYIDDTFSSQVFPASLIHLKKSDLSDESLSSQGTSTRKRKRDMAVERLPLKILFGDS